ncbi:MAG: TIGR01459 family HAD-type hydrolase [Hyphomicrobiaceae bacterium]
MDAKEPNTNIPIENSIAPFAKDVDVWLVDIWGVMHNGVAPFAGAVGACQEFRGSGGTVVLLSNAPRPGDSVAIALDKIGVSRDAWDAIVTSGDAARGLIAQLGEIPIYHIGPERDVPLMDGLGVTRVAPGRAEAIVCSGLFDDTIETPQMYIQPLEKLNSAKLAMVCANPDLRVERGGKIIYCAGAIAAEYEKLGGKVTYAGKPYFPIYQRAFEVIKQLRGVDVDLDRVVAIGDGVLTDIKGAANAGIRSVYIASAIHADDPLNLDAKELQRLFGDFDFAPSAAMTGLRW